MNVTAQARSPQYTMASRGSSRLWTFISSTRTKVFPLAPGNRSHLHHLPSLSPSMMRSRRFMGMTSGFVKVDTPLVGMDQPTPEFQILHEKKVPSASDLSCEGCGAMLQSERPKQAGYVPIDFLRRWKNRSKKGEKEAAGNSTEAEALLVDLPEGAESTEMGDGRPGAAVDGTEGNGEHGHSQSVEMEETEKQGVEGLMANMTADERTDFLLDWNTHWIHKAKREAREQKKDREHICQRCHSLRHNGVAPPVALPDKEFKEKLKLLSKTTALIVKVVDAVDIEASLVEDLAKVVGKNKVMLVVNKADLLPKDVHWNRLEQWMRRYLKAAGVEKIASVHFVSSKTGMGIVPLMRDVQQWRWGHDIYVVGATNAGKSTFVDCLLRTYGPKRKGKGKRGKSEPMAVSPTISDVAGTTLNLLKYPIGSSSYLMDTPGMVMEAQYRHVLTVEELKVVVPKNRIKPITFRLNPGKSLVLGGLASLSLIGGRAVHVTVFASHTLPLHKTSRDRVEAYRVRHAGELLSAYVDEEAKEKRFDFVSFKVASGSDEEEGSWKKAKSDIVWPGLGWVSITAPGRSEFEVECIKGVKPVLRDPMMPFEAFQRVSKFTGSTIKQR